MGRLGKNIRKHRERLALSRSEFARKVGVSPTAVQNWEEQRVTPRPDMMMTISDVLGVDPVFLIDDGEQEEKPSQCANVPTRPGEALAELKRQIADALGVPPSRVDIVVRY
jgi:transcriptional regulator with XRE-family HTH domain